VALFRKEKKKDEYDRDEILKAAEKAERKGDRARAVAEYEKVLRWEPQNLPLHQKVAVLLAESGRDAEAWSRFVSAAEGYVKDGFQDKAAAVYTQASGYLKTKVDLWLALADLHVRRGRRADGVKACLDGRRSFRKLNQQHQASQLLRKALEIEPFHLEGTLDLARLRRRTGGREEARRLLHGVAVRNQGPALRRIRAAQVRLSPTPAALWRWLRAAVAGR
jgi:tetratricopeptide (TPR) repeat protein